MKPTIQFFKNKTEDVLPIIKLTKSKNGTAGTATFLFVEPKIFHFVYSSLYSINGMYLLWENKKIQTKDLEILFHCGKPFLLKAIFIFKNSKEWFQFLHFMSIYSKETGLIFTESNASF